ncbi:DUF433 domain-containing protein [Synechococcus sp. BA-132 BA5]|uniref:DUF433 domain-containing protein n=1 Tax=Synechococcus sp. BA-132 BA5 TaxID=3110252 RepID=UPI002B1EDD01|nr:Fic family protein [Synechococcus sp. BA-132 BA5]MEA5414873.1 Fic family protein [Synechococcus sp. BA-132 BA5]
MRRFANGETPKVFIHPVVRAIAQHFWLAYDHPFCDGNGRTAQALFYWAMLHQSDWLFAFVSRPPVAAGEQLNQLCPSSRIHCQKALFGLPVPSTARDRSIASARSSITTGLRPSWCCTKPQQERRGPRQLESIEMPTLKQSGHDGAMSRQTDLGWAGCTAVERDPQRVSGAWVFRGTRVPVAALFENLEDGLSLAELEGYGLLISTDTNLRNQQNLQGRSIAMLVLTTHQLAPDLPGHGRHSGCGRRHGSGRRPGAAHPLCCSRPAVAGPHGWGAAATRWPDPRRRDRC